MRHSETRVACKLPRLHTELAFIPSQESFRQYEQRFWSICRLLLVATLGFSSVVSVIESANKSTKTAGVSII